MVMVSLSELPLLGHYYYPEDRKHGGGEEQHENRWDLWSYIFIHTGKVYMQAGSSYL